jgi:hypothetical protein
MCNYSTNKPEIFLAIGIDFAALSKYQLTKGQQNELVYVLSPPANISKERVLHF